VGQPVLEVRIGGQLSVVALHGLPRHVVALPPAHDAGLVEPPVQQAQVVVEEPAERHGDVGVAGHVR
jgi:hypothetical protein